MNFLQNNWNAVKPTRTYGVDTDVVAGGFLRPWNHDVEGMKSVCRALEALKPEIVIELGTFEGLGTMRMAAALQKTDKKVDFYTIDVGEAPVNSLGSPYGVPQKFDKNGELIYTTVPWEEFKNGRGTTQEGQGWGSWGTVMLNRDKRLQAGFGKVNLQFIQGFSYDVLPELLEKIGRWDFCFQDTLHYKEDIIKEWVLLKPYSRVGSVIVFDDMYRYSRGQGWVDWFNQNEPDWETRWSEFGHESLWAERIK